MRRVSIFISVFALLTLAVFAGNAQANAVKANNTTKLNVGSSWVGGTVPGATDMVEWDSTVTGANTVSTGGAPTWAGIKISNPGGAVTINSSGAYPTGDINLGASGIDMSAATQNLMINFSGGAFLRPTADQTWTVANGRTLTVNGVGSNISLTLAGEGDISFGSTGMYGWGYVNKNNSGTLTSSNFGSGCTLNLNAGIVQLTARDAVAQVGPITVANGVTLDGGNYLQTLGGNYSGSSMTLNGGTLAGAGTSDGSWMLNIPITVSGGVNTSTISAQKVLLWAPTTFNVASGATNGIDLDVTGNFYANPDAANSFTKSGDGVMRIAGVNYNTGDTTVNAGTLLLDSTSSILMDINEEGDDYTQMLGTGTLVLNGTISLDPSDVTAPGNWTLVDAANLNESYGDDFAVEFADETPFVDTGDVWTCTVGSTDWKFFEPLGVLTNTDPKPGDANIDGFVDGKDAALLAANWLTVGGAKWWEGDFNADGKVNDLDATIMAANWQEASGASVPEPGAIVLLLTGCALWVVSLRRRKSCC